MKTKELSATESAVEAFVAGDCAVAYSVTYTGKENRNGWECDGWCFTVKNQSFEYFTGLGHREDVTAGTKKRAASYFPGLTEKDMAGQTMYGRCYLRHAQTLREPLIPPIAGLLHSIILDGAATEQSFASWCDNFGYDSDSRKALATYMACQENAEKLHRVFTHAQIAHMQELLQGY